MQLIGRASNFLHPLDGEVVDVDNGYIVVAMCPVEMAKDVAKYIEFKLSLEAATARLQEAVASAPVSESSRRPWAWGPYDNEGRRRR